MNGASFYIGTIFAEKHDAPSERKVVAAETESAKDDSVRVLPRAKTKLLFDTLLYEGVTPPDNAFRRFSTTTDAV